MNIVTVFPISKGIFKERLTYWSPHSFTPGSIIDAPLRGKTIPALIETVTPASEAKQDVKNADFLTRKIEKKQERLIVFPSAIKAAAQTANYFASPLGAVIKAIIPDILLKEGAGTNQKVLERDMPGTVADILTYQASDEDRLSTYKSIIREEFARKKSVVIVVPTVLLAEELAGHIKKGIDPYTFLLHGSVSKNKQVELWNKAQKEEHSVVIITTPLFASLPRKDIGTIIIEKEASRGYIVSGTQSFTQGKKQANANGYSKLVDGSSVRQAYFDYRTYLEFYAQAHNIRLVLADSFLQIQTLYRREQGELHDIFPSSFRIEKVPKTLVVDMTDDEHKQKAKEKNDSGRKEGFAIVSEELVSMVEYATKRKERTFIFSARKGLAPQTVCGDCGLTVTCEDCHAPVVLHMSKKPAVVNLEDGLPTIGEDRYFLCHHCGKKQSALQACTRCSSWKLQTLGTGIDTIAESIKKHVPDVEVFVLDRDTVKTDKQAKTMINLFFKTKGAVLIGTETALSYLPTYRQSEKQNELSNFEIPYVAVASLDSLFSLPDFRISERITQIMLKLMKHTGQHFLIQTRNKDSAIIKHISSGALGDFYRDEVALRKTLNYSPFSVGIKITVEGEKASASREMEKILGIVEAYNPMIFPAFIPTVRGRAILHMLIFIQKEKWPDEHLAHILSALPPYAVVKIDPESLL